ncbi:hypothetical protein [Microbacterium timonense]|uniref:hypothetical protein n=1 Tax=Microbacterium timonense TaxID=2086576 RepID=UPI000D0FC6AC|nr:hypothetical protein [Microbacterium timonense]
MSNDDRDIRPGSEADLAIERALQGAGLRAGDAAGTSSAFLVEDREPSAVEAGADAAGVDGD